MLNNTVNICRYKAIGANATSSVISTTWKCISPCLEMLQLLQVIQTGANAFQGSWKYTGCCISPYSFVPINVYSEGPTSKFRVIDYQAYSQLDSFLDGSLDLDTQIYVQLLISTLKCEISIILNVCIQIPILKALYCHFI